MSLPAPIKRAIIKLWGFTMLPLPLPEWPDPTTDAGKQFFANAEAYFKGWLALYYPVPFALGIVANAEAESSLDPNALGDWQDANGARLKWGADHTGATPLSVALHQRKQDRTDKIRDGFVVNGKMIAPGLGIDIRALALAGKNTIANEIAATDWELKTFPSYGRLVMFTMKSAQDVGAEFCIRVERAGAPGAATRRGKMSERWSAYFHSKGY